MSDKKDPSKGIGIKTKKLDEDFLSSKKIGTKVVHAEKKLTH